MSTNDSNSVMESSDKVLIANGSEIADLNDIEKDNDDNSSIASEMPDGINFFERYLSIWVFLCMVTGTLIGYYCPQSVDGLSKAEAFHISIPIGVLLWVMIFPMLMQINFASLWLVVKNPGPIFLTSFVNFGIQPFLMYGIAILFFQVIYSAVISADVAKEYIAGCILLAGAPCTAMVFVWSTLVNGNSAFTLMQVAVNDALILVLYLPTMILLLHATSINLPYDTIAFSVGLFIGAPLPIAIITRSVLIKMGGHELLHKVVEFLKPVTTLGLLASLILIFIYQGETIANKPLHILMIMVPLTIQTFLIFGITYGIGYFFCIDYVILCPAAMISTSNFFELAVAIAISTYGPQSGASLATVVGVLVEVPLMLALVSVCKKLKPYVDNRYNSCAKDCSTVDRLRMIQDDLCCGSSSSRKCESVSKVDDSEIEVV